MSCISLDAPQSFLPRNVEAVAVKPTAGALVTPAHDVD
jgi:hypothetical protein